MIHCWDRTFKTCICSWNAFQVRHLKPTSGLAIIVVALRIILLTVLFAPLLHAMLEDHNHLLLITSNKPTRSTGPTVTEATANFLTGAAWQRGSLILIKPPPWTPLWPFMLERELCNYLDRVFVRQLIDNLRQGCTIWLYTSHPTRTFEPRVWASYLNMTGAGRSFTISQHPLHRA